MQPLSLDSSPPSKAMEAPIQRVFLEVAYDGTNYCGWQVQPRGVSVQSELERALSMLFRSRSRSRELVAQTLGCTPTV